MNRPELFFKALADSSRLEILRLLAGGTKHVEWLADATSLSAGTVSFHLKKLELAGLVTSKKDQYYKSYSLISKALDTSLGEVIGLKADARQTIAEDSYRKKIVSPFIKHGQLKSIPVQKKKRIIVLEEIVKNFQLTKEYSEREVNRILLEWNEDFCTLRRELVSYGFMTRSGGIYSRTEPVI